MNLLKYTFALSLVTEDGGWVPASSSIMCVPTYAMMSH